MKGLALVNLEKVENTLLEAKIEPSWRNIHREDDDADAPAVYDVIVSFLVRLQHDFGSQVTWSATHGLKTKSEMEKDRLRSEGVHSPSAL
jgi:hypothetical protein